MPDKQDFARLGDINFAISDGISGFSNETGYDFAQHDLATGKPTLQAVGESLSQVTISIQLRNFLGHDVPGTIDSIEEVRKSGKAQKLVFASGVYQGQYVIKNISSRVKRTDRNGVITEADLTLSLLEFADRETQSRKKTESRPASEAPKRTLTVEN